MARVFNWGLFYSESLRVFDLDGTTDLLNSATLLKTFEPDLCDVMAQCIVSPCSVAPACGFNPTATCVDDFCGTLSSIISSLLIHSDLRIHSVLSLSDEQVDVTHDGCVETVTLRVNVTLRHHQRGSAPVRALRQILWRFDMNYCST